MRGRVEFYYPFDRLAIFDGPSKMLALHQLVAAAILAVACVVALWRLLRRAPGMGKGSSGPPTRGASAVAGVGAAGTNEVDEVLLPIETSTPMLAAIPISTVTFYTGDASKAAPALRRRVAAVLRANPWLRGQVLRRSEDGVIVLRYTATATGAGVAAAADDDDVDALVRGVFLRPSADTVRLSRGTPYGDLAATALRSGLLV